MMPGYETFELPPAGGRELPLAQLGAAKNPDAAAVARARIAAIEEPLELPVTQIPAVHPRALKTDRHELASEVPLTQVSRMRPVVPSALRPLLTAVGIFLLLLLVFKLPVIINQVQYALSSPSATPSTLPVAGSVIPAEPTITIPKINVHAPVNYEPSMTEASIQKSLETGVVHYGNTALPGQNGNTVIFGHSSNDWWEPGDYKFVFVLLDKLVPGDRFSIDYQSKRYTYEVTATKVVVPTDLSVLAQTAEPTATLITCSPPGTSLKRLIVSAKQVDPQPSTSSSATPTAAASTSTSLPGAAPSLIDQAAQVVKAVFSGITSLFGGTKETSTPATASPSPAANQLPAVK